MFAAAAAEAAGCFAMRNADLPLFWLALSWLLYFGIHSLLASLALKERLARRWPSAMPAYRLAFNVLAVALLVPPLLLTFTYPGPPLWARQGLGLWLAGLAVLGFIWSLRYYDGQEFLGLRQLRAGQTSPLDQEHSRISPLHRYVRHPWYFLGLTLRWTRDLDAAWLLTVTLCTVYFVVGSPLEERKLVRYHGEVYRRYQRRVPGVFPLPWRSLSKAEARELVAGQTLAQAHIM